MSVIKYLLGRLGRSLRKGAAFGVFCAAVVAVMLTGCGSGPEFRVDGLVKGLGTQNLQMVYYADGAFQQVSAPAIDGKFQAIGRTDGPTMVWVYNNAGSLVGRFIADGGDALNVEFSVTNPLEIKVKGNDESELLAKFITDNATLLAKVNRASQNSSGSTRATTADQFALNDAVARFVRRNSGSAAAAAVLTEFFWLDESTRAQAVELLEMIDEDERPENIVRSFSYTLAETEYPDSLLTARHSPLRRGMRLVSDRGRGHDSLSVRNSPRTLLIFSDEHSRRSDSVSNLVRTLSARAGVRLADISFDGDTVTWRRSIGDAGDSPLLRFWAQGAASTPGIEPLRVGRLPFFVVCDSTARILYRGSSSSAALRACR